MIRLGAHLLIRIVIQDHPSTDHSSELYDYGQYGVQGGAP